MPKIACISDIHNRWWDNNLIIPPADYLVIAGDLTIRGHIGEILTVSEWCRENIDNYRAIILIAGNHDFMFQDYAEPSRKYFDIPNVHYLENSSVILNGIKFYGSPQTLWFHDWAFNIKPDQISRYWEDIPEDTDVLITHSPIYGIGDFHKEIHLGCPELRKHSIERVQPKLHVFGHIHSGYGYYRSGNTQIVNAALLDDCYNFINKPIVVEI